VLAIRNDLRWRISNGDGNDFRTHTFASLRDSCLLREINLDFVTGESPRQWSYVIRAFIVRVWDRSQRSRASIAKRVLDNIDSWNNEWPSISRLESSQRKASGSSERLNGELTDE